MTTASKSGFLMTLATTYTQRLGRQTRMGLIPRVRSAQMRGGSRTQGSLDRPPELVPVDPRRLHEASPFVFELPPDEGRGMRVAARVFADGTLLAQIARDRSLAQLANVATLPGLYGA